MQIFLQQVINGVTIGSAYALVAVGFTLIFGVLRLVYLAHGAVLATGGYLGLFALSQTSNVLVALAAGTIGSAILGIVVEVVAVRPVQGENHLVPLVTTISAATLIQEGLRLTIQQGQPISYPANATSELLRFGFGGIELHVTIAQVAVMAVAAIFVVALTWVVRGTWLGRSIRAVADNPGVAAVLGVRVSVISAQTVGIASAMAGAAGVLLGLTLPAIDPYVGEPLQFKALSIALFGGLGSLPGAIVGGMLLGLLEAIAAGYLETSYRDLFAFMAMVIILFIRPSGLLGTPTVTRV
jgi:branched-chain amino acid transport system permease protein